MTSSQTPKPPTVGQELGSSLQALGGGGAGTLFQAESGPGRQLAQLNTAENVDNASTLFNSFAGNLPNAQKIATNAGNTFLSNQIGLEGTDLSTIARGLTKANPSLDNLSDTVNSGSFLGAGLDSTLGGIEGAQASMGSGINPTLSGLSKQLSLSGSTPSLTGVTDYSISNLGQLSPGTSELLNTADQQLSLGGSISPQEQDMVSQASRAADSARGIFDSNASASNELLNLDQYSQQRLATREQLAGNASNIANTQLQNNFNNAYTSAMGGITANQAALNSSANVTGLGLGTQLTALTGASNTQGLALSSQFQRSNAGLAQLGNLAGIGAGNANTGLNFISGQTGVGTGLGTTLFGSGLNAMNAGQANPTARFFNSLGLFSAAQSNAETAYNGSFAAQEQNAQASNSLLGAGIGAGVSGLSALGSSGALTGMISGIGGALAAF